MLVVGIQQNLANLLGCECEFLQFKKLNIIQHMQLFEVAEGLADVVDVVQYGHQLAGGIRMFLKETDMRLHPVKVLLQLLRVGRQRLVQQQGSSPRRTHQHVLHNVLHSAIFSDDFLDEHDGFIIFSSAAIAAVA